MSTPSLIKALQGRNVVPNLTVRLAGQDRIRLRAVSRACRMLAPEIDIQTFEWEACAKALEGAEMVLIQTRIGGQRGRESDETLAIDCGVPADEGLGVGGLSCAVRSWPRLRTILQLVRHHGPGALSILLSSPAGLFIRLAGYEWPDWKLYAICELPFTTLRNISERYGAREDSAELSYSGINHLGFLHATNATGQELIDRYASDSLAPLHAVVREWGAIPLKYLRLHFEREQVMREQKLQPPRGAVLANLQETVMSEFMNGDAARIASALLDRPAPWYEHAVAPLIAARAQAGSRHPFFLSTLERGGMVRERQCSVSPDDIEAAPQTRAPEKVQALTNDFAAYEALAADAIWHRDQEGLRIALKAHPWSDPVTVDRCAREIWNRLEAASTAIEEGGARCPN